MWLVGGLWGAGEQDEGKGIGPPEAGIQALVWGVSSSLGLARVEGRDQGRRVGDA